MKINFRSKMHFISRENFAYTLIINQCKFSYCNTELWTEVKSNETLGVLL